MAGLAVGIVGVIVMTGQPAPRPAAPGAAPPGPPNADRVREYQDRLRAMDAIARQQATPESIPETPAPAAEDQTGPARVDPLVEERRRKDYESLFASNIAVSRRPELSGAPGGPATAKATGTTTDSPSLDQIADAVVRASANAGQGLPSPLAVRPNPQEALGSAQSQVAPLSEATKAGVHRLIEGTVIDAVLTNRLDGGAAGPVNCLVTNPIYSPRGREVVIPAGSRLLGWTRPVQALGETRLAVGFHRLVFPDGRSQLLEQLPALNPVGDVGLKDRANHHYWSMFGAAGAVGVITGLAQWIGTAGLSSGDGDRTVVIAGSAGDATAQASQQALSRFLNRLPTVTIREGHRLKVYLTRDLEVPIEGRRALP
jgi:type IV secretion system protein TrbI